MSTDSIYVKLSDTLELEMSGGSWAQARCTYDLYCRISRGERLTRDEACDVLDGVETAVIGMEAVRDGASLDFAEARSLHAALRSGYALVAKLEKFLASD